MMLIIAGMRYITAAGNSASVTDAKGMALSAITGLLLALLSFVIIKTINPDVLYLKKPGANLVAGSVSSVGACGKYDPALPATGNCKCNDGSIIAATSATDCADSCDNNIQCSKQKLKKCIDPKNPFNTQGELDKAGLSLCHCVNGNAIPIGRLIVRMLVLQAIV